MSHEEFDKELTYMKEQLNVLMELLKQNVEEKRYGWSMEKKISWPTVWLFTQKLRNRLIHMLKDGLRKEKKNSKVKFRQNSMVEE